MIKHKFIFIGGLHKSGTSIIHRCLREHPLISGFKNTKSEQDEGQHLQSVYLPAKSYGGGPGRFGFYKEARLTENSSIISETNKRKLFSEWKQYWNLEKQYLIEKSPPSIIRTRFMQKMFPESYFIICIRHPIAVSFATKKWGFDYSILSLIKHWLHCYEIFDEDKKFLKNIFIIKYEDFVASPQDCLMKICHFLHIESFEHSEKIHSNLNEKYFRLWRRKRNLFLRKYISLKFEKKILKFGYSLDQPQLS